MPSNLILPILLLIVSVALAFWLGWDTAVYKQRRRAKQLKADYAELLNNSEEVLLILQTDPAAAALETGRQYAVTRMRQSLDDIEQEPLP